MQTRLWGFGNSIAGEMELLMSASAPGSLREGAAGATGACNRRVWSSPRSRILAKKWAGSDC